MRVDDPAEITYKMRPASWATDGDPVIVEHLQALTAEVGARLDGAYWVDDVVVAGEGDVTGFVELVSGGIARRRTGTSDVAGVRVDGPTPYLLTGVEVSYGEGSLEDTLSGTLTNVSALTVDVGRAGLSDSPALDIAVDRTVTITFVRDGVTVGSVTLEPSGS